MSDSFNLDAVKARLHEMRHGVYDIAVVEDDLAALVAVASAATVLAQAVESAHGPNRRQVVNAALNEYWRTVGIEP